MATALRILWVKSGALHPLDTGGRKRTHSMLVEISRQHEVTYLALKEEGLELAASEEGAAYAARKLWVPWKDAAKGTPAWFGKLLANLLFSSMPYALAKYQSRLLEAEIERQCAAEKYDLVVCDFLTPAANFLPIRGRLGVPTVLFQHNIEAQIWRRLASGKRNLVARWYFGLQARRMARWERRLSRIFSGVITVSPEDSETARSEYDLTNILGDVPTGVDTAYFRPPSERVDAPPTIGFLGSMDWMPNIEGVEWFVGSVFPDLEERIDGARLLVIGRRPPASIRELAAENSRIEVTGTVDDVRPCLARCDVLVVPLLSGGGTRIKIMEALAAGLAVVSTTVGAEGLGLTDGEHLLIADSADDFSEAVQRLMTDEALRWRLGRAGRKLVEEEFSWASATDVFMAHCGAVLKASCRAKGTGTE